MRPHGIALLCAGLVGMLGAGRCRAAELPANVFAVSPEDEVQDIVFFADAHPVFVRFHTRVGATPFRTAWGEFAVRLHRYLDVSGDGVLTLKEAQRAGWQQALFQGPFSPRRAMAGGGPTAASLDANKDGKVSIGELMNHLRSNQTFEAFSVQPGESPDAKMQALFAHLDLDHDGRLSSQELDAADDCFSRLDLDEDELLSLVEMQPYQNAYAERFRPGNQGMANFNAETAMAVAIAPGEALKKLAQRLISKYNRSDPEKKKDGLSQEDLDVDAGSFGRSDSNHDGVLNLAELERFLLQVPPTLEFNLTLAAKSPGGSKFEPVSPSGPSSAHKPTLQKRDNGGRVLELGSLEVEFTALGDSGGARQFYLQRFKAFDADGNGYLDKKEAENRGVFQQMFAVADRDNDGKLYVKELEAFVDLEEDAAASRIGLAISDHGRALFEVLDTNQDQQLCLRELRKVRALLEKTDRNSDGQVSQGEIPHRYQLAIGRGQAPVRRGIAVDSYASPPRNPKSKAPSWFTRMDRNQDGDLSLREFLGSLEDFKQFDADGDGLIDPQEAGKAP